MPAMGFKIVLAILGSLYIHIDVKIKLLIAKKNVCWNFGCDYIKCIDQFRDQLTFQY